jgi:hypothetical protein
MGRLNLVFVTSDIRMLIRGTNHELIIKLIVQIETNLREEFINPN